MRKIEIQGAIEQALIKEKTFDKTIIWKARCLEIKKTSAEKSGLLI